MLSVSLHHTLGEFTLDAAFRTERDTGVVALGGPSGAGKSSVLRCIVGLERPQRGHVVVGDRTLFDAERGIDIPVHDRRVGMVFQDARLFPHLSVRANLEYGARRGEGVSLDEVVGLLGIEGLLDRRPRSLSGGEQQRVAIGRALRSGPDLLVMDEPLASLDQARKTEVLPFLAALPRRLSIPIVYVTHSFDEILQLADELIVLDGGRVVASGAVPDATAVLRGEEGQGSVLEGVVREGRVVVDGLALEVIGATGLPDSTRVRLRIPADDVVLAIGEVPAMSVRNRWAATVVAVEPVVRGQLVSLRLDGAPSVLLRARVTAASVADLALAPGRSVTALVKAASIRIPGRAGLV